MSLTIILLIMTGWISYQAFENKAMYNKLAFHPGSIKEFGQLYRFVSSGFVHSSWEHLFVNLWSLYLFGEITEGLFNQFFGLGLGKIIFVLFYISAIVISAIPDYFKYQDNMTYSAVGASGATSALVFSYVLFAPWQWFVIPPLPAIVFGIGFLWYSSYLAKKGIDNIGHYAHFWGAVYGIFFIVISAAAFQPEFLTHFINALLDGPQPFPAF